MFGSIECNHQYITLLLPPASVLRFIMSGFTRKTIIVPNTNLLKSYELLFTKGRRDLSITIAQRNFNWSLLLLLAMIVLALAQKFALKAKEKKEEFWVIPGVTRMARSTEERSQSHIQAAVHTSPQPPEYTACTQRPLPSSSRSQPLQLSGWG